MAQIFLSYSRKNKNSALRLKKFLQSAGFSVWMDEEIPPSSDWWATIEQKIEECSAFVLVESPDAQESDWIKDEIHLARTLKKVIFPVLILGDLRASLSRIQVTDLRSRHGKKRAKELKKLTEELSKTISGNVSTALPEKTRNKSHYVNLFRILFFLVVFSAVGLVFFRFSNAPDEKPDVSYDFTKVVSIISPTPSFAVPTSSFTLTNTLTVTPSKTFTYTATIPIETEVYINYIASQTQSYLGLKALETEAWQDIEASETAIAQRTDTPVFSPTPTPNRTATYQAVFATIVQKSTEKAWTQTPTPTITLTPTATQVPVILDGNLILSMNASTDAATPGTPVTWAVRIRNQTYQSVSDIEIVDTLPETLSIESVTNTHFGHVFMEDRLVHGFTGKISPGEEFVFLINTVVADDVPTPSTVSNTVCSVLLGSEQVCRTASISVGARVENLPSTGGDPENPIIDELLNEPDTSIFGAALLSDPSLLEILFNTSPITLFVPSDEVFAAWLSAQNISVDDLLTQRVSLKEVLLNHMVAGRLMPEAISQEQVLTTLSNQIIKVSRLDEGLLLNDQTLTIGRNIASDGVIYVIDHVLEFDQ
ncbi:MAG TPA: TIR domain-containing protein [Phototrophicaceae bacterium]|nr:TIR domain-containing protein [Phototrophicaceae bacterium]